jgi:adenosyl cobinamide kinase/adenosyl cobinamide phosphate guanylyltransferase
VLTVLLGGARSGKSRAAVRIARATTGRVCYVATSPRIDGDRELDARIDAHRAERPPNWDTIEAETDLAGAIAAAADAFVIVDCLTVWLGNLLHHGLDDAAVGAASEASIDAAVQRSAGSVIITNDVGSGIVPADAMTRRYRDLLGGINQRWVAVSDAAHLVVAGRALSLTELGQSLP